MRRFLVAALLLTVAAVIPADAVGKGASEATITGPGLDEPIVLAGEGQAGGELLMEIAVESGFFPAVFEQTPDPMRDAPPAGELGPEYVVAYAMPGPNYETDTVLQKLYPYARGGPVSYVEPGQRFWTTEETKGGWFFAGAALEDLLIAAGLPPTAPSVGSAPADSRWTVLGPIAALVAIGAVCALAAALAARRGPQPA